MPNRQYLKLEKRLEKLRAEPDNSELVIALNDIAYACIHSDPGKSEAFSLEAFNLATKLGIRKEQARSYLTLGVFHLEAGDFDKASSETRNAMDIYESLQDNCGIASVYSNLANIFFVQGMIVKALENYHIALRKIQGCEVDGEKLARSYFNVGVCYNTIGRLEQAISFYEQAESFLQESGERSFLASLYNNIGTVYGKKKELGKAKEYFQNALDIRQDIGDKTGTAITLSNLGNLNEDLGNIESALDFYLRSGVLYEEIGNRRGVACLCAYVGGIYTSLGSLDEAEEAITRGLSITQELNLKGTEILCLEKIMDLFEAKGDFQKALKHSRELKKCVEENMNEQSMEKIARLQVQFKTEKKEKEAEIYRLKNVELSRMNDDLRAALEHVKRLQGLLPICAKCKKVRNDDGYWQQIESYVTDHSAAQFSHGICPECATILYGDI